MIEYNFNFLSGEDTRLINIGENAERKIDNLIQSYFRQASLHARTVYEREAPVGETGELRSALQRSTVRKGLDGKYSFELWVPPIDTGGSEAESFYPLYVTQGTKGPIFAKNSNVLALRRKSKGRKIFAFKESVAGQAKNNFFGRMNQSVGFMYFNPLGKNYQDLKRKISDIVADAKN